MFCRDFVDDSNTMIIDKKRFEEMTMPRCDIIRLKNGLITTKRKLLDMQRKIMIDNGTYGECHPLYKMINETIKNIDEALDDKN